MTKTAADFPVGSKVWVIDNKGVGEGTVLPGERSEYRRGGMVDYVRVQFDGYNGYVTATSCFSTEFDAVTEVCARLDAEAEHKRIAWSEAVKAAGAMRLRLQKLSKSTK